MAHTCKIDVCFNMEEKWSKLRRSAAPLALKLLTLPPAVWAQALHGAGSCRFPFHHLQQHRTKALRPLLRLSLASPPPADPDYILLPHTVMNFRRICAKSPELSEHWIELHGRLPRSAFPQPLLPAFSFRSGWLVGG